MKELTRAEEEVIQILWDRGPSFVKDIVSDFPEDKRPAYNTISTIVRILVKKEMVGINAFGRSHQYYALVSKEDYRKSRFKKLMSGYFGGSYKQLLSFFVNEEELSVSELDQLIQELKDTKDDDK
jgi:predicted transcriptional regulator